MLCPACGAPNGANRESCARCGEPLRVQDRRRPEPDARRRRAPAPAELARPAIPAVRRRRPVAAEPNASVDVLPPLEAPPRAESRTALTDQKDVLRALREVGAHREPSGIVTGPVDTGSFRATDETLADPSGHWADMVGQMKDLSGGPLEPEPPPRFPSQPEGDLDQNTLEDPLDPRRSWSEIAKALGQEPAPRPTTAPAPREPITAPAIHFEDAVDDGFPTMSHPVQVDLQVARPAPGAHPEPELPPGVRPRAHSEDATNAATQPLPQGLGTGEDLMPTVNEIPAEDLDELSIQIEAADPATDIAPREAVLRAESNFDTLSAGTPAASRLERLTGDLGGPTQLLDPATASSLGLPVPDLDDRTLAAPVPRQPSRPTDIFSSSSGISRISGAYPAVKPAEPQSEPILEAQPVSFLRSTESDQEEESILGFLVEPTAPPLSSGADAEAPPEYTVAAPGELAGLDGDVSFPDFGEGLSLDDEPGVASHAVRQGLAAPVPQRPGADSLELATPPFEAPSLELSSVEALPPSPFDEPLSDVPNMSPHEPAEVTDSAMEALDSGQLSMPGDAVIPLDHDDGWLHPALPSEPEPVPEVGLEDTRHLPQAQLPQALLPVRLHVTPLWRRLAALSVDGGLGLGMVLLVAGQVLAGTSNPFEPEAWILILARPETLLMLALTGVAALALLSGFEAFLSRSPGKLCFGLWTVESRTGHRLGTPRALGRTVVSMLGLSLLGAGFAWILVDRRCRAWHDVFTGTVVVRELPNS